MKITRIVLVLALIAGGYFIRDVVEPTKGAKADVAGMTYTQLKRDRAFKKAVIYIVSNNCFVTGESIYC